MTKELKPDDGYKITNEEWGNLQDIIWFLKGYTYANDSASNDFGKTHVETMIKIMRILRCHGK